MAKDVKFLISANVDRAEREIQKLQNTGAAVSDSLSRSFQALGISSTESFEKKRLAAQNAYTRIKESGVATKDELIRIEKALGSQLASIDEEQFGKRISLAEKYNASMSALGVKSSTAFDAQRNAAKDAF